MSKSQLRRIEVTHPEVIKELREELAKDIEAWKIPELPTGDINLIFVAIRNAQEAARAMCAFIVRGKE